MGDISDKKIEIIQRTAVNLFKKYGYNKVSVNDICTSAGVSRSVFYTVFAGKKAILDSILAAPRQNQAEAFQDFVAAENDFERIWYLCNRFITIALDFGPELTKSLFMMQLTESAGITEAVHSLDDWFIKLARNCREAGILEGDEPLEIVAPLATDLICQVTYQWCKSGGAFALRDRARLYAEIAYRVSADYRKCGVG